MAVIYITANKTRITAYESLCSINRRNRHLLPSPEPVTVSWGIRAMGAAIRSAKDMKGLLSVFSEISGVPTSRFPVYPFTKGGGQR
jgi:hypothetical protein